MPGGKKREGAIRCSCGYCGNGGHGIDSTAGEYFVPLFNASIQRTSPIQKSM